VQQGLKNGSLVLAPDGQLSSAPPSSSYVAPATQAQFFAPSSSSPSAYSAPTSSSIAAYSAPASSSSSSEYVAPTTSSSSQYVAPTTSSSSSSAPSPSSYSSGGDDSSDSGSSGVDRDFPDGEIDCSHFPSDYGPIDVHWMGLGGWTGVQAPGSSLGGFANIKTAISGEGCTEGAFCSYACPAGYQKSQWPTTQGATGQSVGGIQCTNGKLHLTNPTLSTKLCMQGASQVDITVQNNLSGNVAICRTDYPGTEGETVPVNALPGQTQPLTCPDAEKYYNWEGGSTSAQYYVNPAGVSVSDACQWGSIDNPWGNYAPLNLGVGYSAGRAWLAIFQNFPTQKTEHLNFTVEIVGDNLSGNCKYSNGQYCGSTGCSSMGGCTVRSSQTVLIPRLIANNRHRHQYLPAKRPSSSRTNNGNKPTRACVRRTPSSSPIQPHSRRQVWHFLGLVYDPPSYQHHS